MNASWSQGVVLGLPILAVAILLLVAPIVGAFIWGWADGMGMTGLGLIAAFCAGILALVLAGAGFSYYPYKAEYHQWRPTSGTIDTISSRLLGGDTITQRFVVRFTDGRERACDDTRCALLKPGDHLTLTCKREWQFAGRDGWSCNYVGRRP